MQTRQHLWCPAVSVTGNGILTSDSAWTFLRLGLVIGVTTAIAGGVAVAASGGAAASGYGGAASAAAAGAEAVGAATGGAAGTATGAAAGAQAAAGVFAAAAGHAARSAGGHVASAGPTVVAVGREGLEALLKDIALRPQQASNVISGMWQRMSSISGDSSGASPTAQGDFDSQRRYYAEQQETLVTALNACLSFLEVRVPKTVAPLLQEPVACARLCEILVDVLEETRPQEERGCAIIIKSFLQDLDG